MSVIALIQRNHEKNYNLSKTKKTKDYSYALFSPQGEMPIASVFQSDDTRKNQINFIKDDALIPLIYDENYKWV